MTKPDRSRRILIGAGILFVIVSVGIDQWRRRVSSPAGARKTSQITRDGGLATDPSVSQKLLAYASDRAGAGNLDIWVRPLAGGEARRVTSGPADEHEPALSPDGARIAYRSEEGRGVIYTMTLSGGQPTLVAEGGREPRFSPDGRRLAWWKLWDENRGELYVAPAGGGTPVRLAATLKDARHPVWSPDSKHILFRGAEDRRPDWYVVDAGGGRPARTGAITVLQVQGFGGDVAPSAWTEAGVLFAGRFRDSVTVWRLSISSTFQCSRPAVQVSETPGEAPAEAAGGGVVFATRSSKPAIWMSRNGEARAIVTEAPPAGRFTVSADGRKLLYWTAGGVRWKDLESGAEREVEGAERGHRAVLSADGGTVFYWGGGSLHAAPAAGGEGKRVCEHCGNPWSVSRDGSRLLYSIGWRRGVGLVYTATGEKRELLRQERLNIHRALFSPDGRSMLVQVSREHEPIRMYVAPFREGASAPEKDWVALNQGGAGERSPAWSADGKLIYYLSERDGFRCIWAQPARGGEALAVEHFHGARRTLADPRSEDDGWLAAAAGGKLFYMVYETTGELFWAR